MMALVSRAVCSWAQRAQLNCCNLKKAKQKFMGGRIDAFAAAENMMKVEHLNIIEQRLASVMA